MRRELLDETTTSAEWQRVLDWRFRRLIGAGFDLGAAGALAAARDVDLHALLDLVDRGCPPPLAARIHAPADLPGWVS